MLHELKIKDTTIRIYPWKRAYQITEQERNTILFTMARTKKRENLFKWVGPIAPREISLWKLKARTDIKVTTWEDAKKYRIGTVRGEAGEDELVKKGFIIGKNLDSITTQKQNYGKLFLNRIDFLCGLDLSTAYGVKKAGFNFAKLEKSLVLSSGLS